MDQRAIAEQQYQRGLHYAQATEGERQENLQRATACYETALQYYTAEAFPKEWQQLQEDMAAAYSELVRERLKQNQNLPEQTRTSRYLSHPRLTLQQRLLLGLVVVIILAIPTTAIATSYLARSGPDCVRATLNMDGSTVLQPLLEVVSADYMQHCSGAIITVGGGASKTGLADVEQGHNYISGVRPEKDWGHTIGHDVPIQIGNSDVFASPVQHDLIDHQVAIGVFALILNQRVTGLHNLSTPQIQGIYTGVYQNWRQICDKGRCGPDLPIVPISRTLNSGTRFTFEKYILKGVATVPGIGLYRTSASSNAVQEVENNIGSIGYAPLYIADQAHDITILTIDGQGPHNTSAVQRNAYKFWNIEHMYTQGKGSALAQALINYMYSDVAKRLLPRFDLLDPATIPRAVRDQHILETQ
jgi:phosphate transport system substrate-binding protein